MFVSTSIPDWLASNSPAIEQAIRRAASPGYDSWWQRCASVGFCANPIQASAYDPDRRRRVPVMIRCGNRRAAICPSCSDLYAADTWQLVHAGTQGGHHGMHAASAQQPSPSSTSRPISGVSCPPWPSWQHYRETPQCCPGCTPWATADTSPPNRAATRSP
jgi:hypothetical protein